MFSHGDAEAKHKCPLFTRRQHWKFFNEIFANFLYFFKLKNPLWFASPIFRSKKAKFRSKQNTAQKPRTYSIAGKGQARSGGSSSQVRNLEFQFLPLCHKPEVWCTWWVKKERRFSSGQMAFLSLSLLLGFESLKRHPDDPGVCM
jgi:hypothetical protein